MAISRIEQLIEDIYEFVESCKMQAFSSTKVIVPKDELYDLLDELRLRTPDEIKRYQKIIANRDAILADAEEKAKAIVENADNRALSMINEHEIMQQAYDQANNLVNQANAEAERILAEASYEAEQIMSSSLRYTQELLTNVESIVSNVYAQSNRDYEALTSHLKGTLDLIKDNKGELALANGDEVKEEEEDFSQEEYEEEYSQEDYDVHNDNDDDDYEDDYDFDEDTFLKDID
ncbi:MAG: ATP synthase F0 subunit B [Clostridiales bacterium]|nr:ATP synthase F0 subunit B [Clostridiales bacterium]